MPVTRRDTFKALVATVAGATLPSTAKAKAIQLPVTPHEIGKCPDPSGDMCGNCHEVMTEDYEDAMEPVRERALVAFWKSVHEDLPFFKKTNSFESDLTDDAQAAIACDSFEQWQATPEACRIRLTLPPVGNDDA
jgi:hypothetical protein